MKKAAGGYRLVFGYLGIFLILIGIICLLPLFTLFGSSSEEQFAQNFYIPGAASIVVGCLLYSLIVGREKQQLGKYQDSVLLVLIWLCAIFVCAVPFAMSSIQLGEDGMNFTEAVFESASGFGTIGLTRFKMFDSHAYLLFRSLLLFFGGIGLILVVTSAISDRYGLKLYNAEGHNDKLLPNLASSARLILGIYILYIILGTIAYTIAGMPLFDSFNHSISAVATGGFSTKPGGLSEIMMGMATPNQLAIEIISCVLMLLGATNFLIHLSLITGKFKKIGKDCEFRLLVCLFLIFIPLFFVSSFINFDFQDPFNSLRYGTFTFISSITTTGFSNIPNVVALGEGVLFLIVIVNIIGGGMGSTAGGTKLFRIAVAFKSFYWSLRYRMSSKKYIYPYFIWRNGEKREVTPSDSIECFGYILLYVAVMFVGAFFIIIFGLKQGIDFDDAVFEFSNALSSTGLSNGLTAVANTGVLWTLIVGMIAGRLEILAIYFAGFRIVRDVLRKETN